LTVAELIRKGTDRLAPPRPADEARPEVELLLAHALGHSRSWLYARPEHRPDGQQAAAYCELVERRAQGVPLEYLTGRAAFHDIELEVTPDVLIPRPETEVLVEEALSFLRGTDCPLMADVGTGSGAVVLALAHALPQLRAVATDVSRAALLVAARNMQALGVTDRVMLVNCDLLSAIGTRFCLVTANLPYVSTEDLEGPAAIVALHEPRVALDGGPGGLQLVRRLLEQLPEHLAPGGLALFEIGSDQGAQAAAMAQSLLPGAEVSVVPDQWRLDRVLRVRMAE
jgi:release factor glutamine methyltransferase